jgi:ribosome maturation factor RimP
MGVTPDVLAADLAPLVAGLGLDVHDVEFAKSLVRVSVHRKGGVSIDDLAEANRLISEYLDDHEPFEGRYTLEVSSPGVERKLRTPAHFAAAVGETVAIKTIPDVALVPDRRIEGELIEATADAVVVSPPKGESVTLDYDQIDRARTVYAWGPAPKPSPSRGGAPKGKKRAPKTAPERTTTP